MAEIASLSLAFQKIAVKFQIQHLSNEQLKVRIGFHTGTYKWAFIVPSRRIGYFAVLHLIFEFSDAGPVLSGVVGTKMPRYSLVGPTVVYAVYMEQTSLGELIDDLRPIETFSTPHRSNTLSDFCSSQ